MDRSKAVCQSFSSWKIETNLQDAVGHGHPRDLNCNIRMDVIGATFTMNGITRVVFCLAQLGLGGVALGSCILSRIHVVACDASVRKWSIGIVHIRV